ncbi:hypothetical protein Bca101_053703 [Brassica carinata]
MGSSSPPIEDNVDIGSREDEDEFMNPDSDQRGKRKHRGSAEDYNESNKEKRVLPTRSEVWSHFKRLEDNRDKCMCNYCLKHFACPTKSGTTNLRNHLQSCKQYKAWQEDQWLKQDIKFESKVLKNAQLLADVESDDKFQRGL